jgi:hypothetical protein
MALTLEVAYANAAALAHDAASQLAQGGLFVAVDASALPPLAPLTLRLLLGGAAFEAAARLTVASAQAACVELDAAGRGPLLAALAAHLGATVAQAGERRARIYDAAAQRGSGGLVQTHKNADELLVADALEAVDIHGANAQEGDEVSGANAQNGGDGEGAAAHESGDGDGANAHESGDGDGANAHESGDGDGAAAHESGDGDGAAAGRGDGPHAAGAPRPPEPRAAAAEEEEADGPAAQVRAQLSLDRRIAVMSVNEKVQLALHGNRDARALLLHERAGVVQSSLARNPKITLDEVQALARSPQLSPDAAEMLSQHPSWGSAAGVVLALVRNPRTPLTLATALVARLIPSDLRVIAKGLGVRPQVAMAARKRMFDPER